MNEAAARRDLVRYSAAMHRAGFAANHDGNLSARLDSGRIVCTPTAFSKADVALEDLLVVDAEGRRLAGSHKPFSELGLHLAVYAARPEVRAVVHAHPPFATAFGAAGQKLPHPFLPEAVVSLGAEIPTVPLTGPGKPAVAALTPLLTAGDAVLLAGNGALTWGPDVMTAWLRMELLEHLARIAHAATALGGVRPLPPDLVKDLLGRRAAAGLGAPGEKPAAPPPAPSEAVKRAADRAVAAIPNADPALVAKIAAEVAARLSR